MPAAHDSLPANFWMPRVYVLGLVNNALASPRHSWILAAGMLLQGGAYASGLCSKGALLPCQFEAQNQPKP